MMRHVPSCIMVDVWMLTMSVPVVVVPNGDGGEFIFTLLRKSGMTEEQFEADKLAVAKDLMALKEILEDRY